MRIFFHKIWHNLLDCFSWPYLLAHLAAGALTFAAAVSGFDWWWYANAIYFPRVLLFPGIMLGGLLPMVVPFVVLAIAMLRKNDLLYRTAGALGQAGFLGWLVSSSYKAFTGRAHPTFGTLLTRDISNDFRFGFLKAGIFWGWPSSHTTVAFATAVALAVMYKEKARVKVPALLYALYVGLAVSISIHWFSDFLAGALIGTVIGLVVGKSFGAADGNAALKRMHYFAYGSLMSSAQMRGTMETVGGKASHGRSARLEGYRLSFNKTSKKWSPGGAANVMPAPGSVVEGVVYEIDEIGIGALDAREKQYDRTQVTVRLEDGKEVVAEVYVAQPQVIDEALKPSKAYLACLFEGREFLTEPYLENLKKTSTVD